ncbi:hypothetical protein W97_00445 [Coniosporium apollinis CBS 100218]|uniref:Uncharacterized protein n=1 Tax=Coniosporium apollinis (strain CBS 100218) TaxID=1168221 RepID=R7YH48_CONA1|nr:uncharacterized protein W97_00445 [Coniosporium apollinis CBS 100218]EON61232.1 hypothetical protein W97_00445 [Coniosporium apollinis CBS 100218]
MFTSKFTEHLDERTVETSYFSSHQDVSLQDVLAETETRRRSSTNQSSSSSESANSSASASSAATSPRSPSPSKTKFRRFTLSGKGRS